MPCASPATLSSKVSRMLGFRRAAVQLLVAAASKIQALTSAGHGKNNTLSRKFPVTTLLQKFREPGVQSLSVAVCQLGHTSHGVYSTTPEYAHHPLNHSRRCLFRKGRRFEICAFHKQQLPPINKEQQIATSERPLFASRTEPHFPSSCGSGAASDIVHDDAEYFCTHGAALVHQDPTHVLVFLEKRTHLRCVPVRVLPLL